MMAIIYGALGLACIWCGALFCRQGAIDPDARWNIFGALFLLCGAGTMFCAGMMV